MGDKTGDVPQPKKRKKQAYILLHPDVSIKLRAADAAKFQLENSTFLSVEELKYITFNSDESSYLYSICSVLFEVPTEQLTILKSPVGVTLPEDSEEWQMVEGEHPIVKGNYLLIFDESSCNTPLSSPFLYFSISYLLCA
jgi:hypothetical protein